MFTLVLFAVVATLFAGWRVGRRLRFFLHLFQLEGYKPNEYRTWLGKRWTNAVFRLSHRIGLALLGLAAVGFAYGPAFWTALLLCLGWGIAFASSRRYRSEQPKKPLALTARMKRLLGAALVLTVLPVVVGAAAGLATGDLRGFGLYFAGFFVADLGVPLWVLLAAALMKPIEHRIQEGFKAQARQTLRTRPDLKVIGITGSYGKTSVKFIVAEILRQRYRVLATPGSYNTPMGICLVVNNQLKPEHQVLVLEFGMRYRGDIRELCDLAPPDLAIETSVGVAHLETMGSLENIALEKSDMLRYMKPGGPVVLNADDPHVAAMASLATGKVWRVSVEGRPEADLTAHDLRYGPAGATFTVKDDEGHTALFQTRLLGKHNVLNILIGLAVGRELGLRLRQMVPAVARIEPVEHRLQLRPAGAITIIDDAFNSNPVGARNAVEILGQFTTGRRVIVTPGMVELGARQHEENYHLGQHIAAQHLDLAVLVGERQTVPLQEGLRAAGYPEDRLKVMPSLFAARDFLQTWLQPGDVVLYENDLPDQYNEG
jgi:UDP-N-acetylmuramoyl-tripeptide--D-alanyl-D-alanine ligase